MIVSFPLAFLVIRSIKETNYDDENVGVSRVGVFSLCLILCALQMVFVGDLKRDEVEKGSTDKVSLEAEKAQEASGSKVDSTLDPDRALSG